MRSIRRPRRADWWLALPVAIAMLSATGAVAQPASSGGSVLAQYGFRGGFSIDPDQFVIGGFLGFQDFSPGFSLRPSLDLGFGDSVFTFMVNGDGQYHFLQADFPAIPYMGVGLGFAYYNVDVPNVPGVSIDDSFNEVGLTLFGGLEWDLSGYRIAFAELRIGVGDIPDVKLMGGFGFL